MMYVVVADARSLYCRATVAYVAPPKTISCVETSNIKKGSLETSEGRKQLQDLYYVGMYVQAEHLYCVRRVTACLWLRARLTSCAYCPTVLSPSVSRLPYYYVEKRSVL
jgi:hypothetical protein